MPIFVERENRSQSTRPPDRVDIYVAEDNPVRVIDVYVGELNLCRLGHHLATMLKRRFQSREQDNVLGQTMKSARSLSSKKLVAK